MATEDRRRILVPLDGSRLAELALSEARVLAQPGSEVILLQVVAPIEDVIAMDGDEFTIDEQWERRKIQSEQYLRGVASRPEWRGVNTRVAVEMGKPADTILDFASKQNVDYIVMTTHGRTGLSRWVYGSVADKLLHAADRTVVLVRAGHSPDG